MSITKHDLVVALALHGGGPPARQVFWTPMAAPLPISGKSNFTTGVCYVFVLFCYVLLGECCVAFVMSCCCYVMFGCSDCVFYGFLCCYAYAMLCVLGFCCRYVMLLCYVLL